MDSSTLKRLFNLEGKDYSEISIDALLLGTRALNCLRESGIETVEQLLNCSVEHLYSIKNMGKASINEIIKKLKEYLEYQTDAFSPDHPENVRNMYIDVLNLSVWAKNGLKKAGITTIGALLDLSVEKLCSTQNLGKKSVEEIIIKRERYMKDFAGKNYEDALKRRFYSKIIDDRFKAHIDELILNPEYYPENLTPEQQELFANIKTARRELGANLSLDAYKNYEEVVAIRDVLAALGEESALYADRHTEILNAFGKMPSYMLEKRLMPFVKAYCLEKNIENIKYYSEALNFAKVKNLIFLFENEYRAVEDKYSLFTSALKFAVWLNFDIYNEAVAFAQKMDYYELGKNTRNMQILKFRISKHTLEETGAQYNLTRERIRQIVDKKLKKTVAVYKHLSHDLMLFIYALEDGSPVITQEIATKYLGKSADLIFFMLKSGKDYIKISKYEYQDDVNAVVINAAISKFHKTEFNAAAELLEKLNNSLPKFIQTDDLDEEIIKYCKDHNINEDFGKKYIYNKREKHGIIMCVSKPFKRSMFKYVLKRYFPEGYKIENEQSKNKLVYYVRKLFGYDYSCDAIHSTDVIVQDVAFQTGRGLYNWRPYNEDEARAVAAVNEFIAVSDRMLFTFNELFEKFKPLFVDTNIKNSYILHGALKQYGTPFKMQRDSIGKKDDYSFLDELEAFAGERIIFTKGDLLEFFSGTSATQIMQAIERSDLIFGTDNSKYVFAPSAFEITKRDEELIEDYLERSVYDSPADLNTVFEELRTFYPEFLNRNKITDSCMLWAALQYMFKDKFKFARPFISKIEEPQ